MNLTAVLDHSALTALYQADPFFTGLYIEASRGTGRILVPSLAALAAERQVPGAGQHATRLRFFESVAFTAGHAVDAMAWPDAEWPVAHAAAIAWKTAREGEPVTVLSLVPDLYTATGIVPLDPTA
ncbi:PIN domain-containing protein [Streptomyces sp. NPDC093795]|uniref:PIN domain-containing protein n=1 Tax=Streptomyces sp. NPDC093795 TaxID=3366051 RepID=UPI00380BB771